MLKNIQKNINLTPYTTYRIGGDAEYFASPTNEKEIIEIRNFAKSQNLPLYILGAGSNVLVSDKGIKGVVLHLDNNFAGCEIIENTVKAKAGTRLTYLINTAKKYSLSGLEPLIGIPGTVGGAIVMNAGAFNCEISKYLVKVVIFDMLKGEIYTEIPVNLDFGYRKSNLYQENKLVIEGIFQLIKRDTNLIEQDIQKFSALRKQKQKIRLPNAGSVFKNPPDGLPAGKLLDDLNVKRLRIGNAMVAPEHANFIVNSGGATANDVYLLIKKLQNLVYEHYNIKLEPEIKFLGEF